MDVPAWKKGLRFLQINKQSFPAAVHSIVMSLYEDPVAAWVPAKHEWLWPRPLGQELVNRLRRQKMFSYCASGSGMRLGWQAFSTNLATMSYLSSNPSIWKWLSSWQGKLGWIRLSILALTSYFIQRVLMSTL
ncbi:hypothetical protein ACSBR2_038460 [Camellia fascicularis]